MNVTYAVVFERAESNYAAYVPDLPGCISVGDTLEEANAMIGEAIALLLEHRQSHGNVVEPPTRSICGAIRYHLDLVTEDGEEPPNTETIFDMVDVHVDIDVELAPAPTAADAAPNTPETAKV